jgi:tRNA pseudouridine55 synthase
MTSLRGAAVTKRDTKARNVTGILLLDKPSGLTSNRALQRVKRLFRAAKAGHAGSLDPLATGMLPISFGGATRLSHYLLNAHKTYRVTSRLGAATDTGDADGVVTERAGVPALTAVQIEARAGELVGEIEQVPPMYSALKYRGRRLYELARAGRVVERAPRRVRIESITDVSYRCPDLSFTVTCSKGTYVRTLAADLARALGTLAHVTALRRLEVVPFENRPMYGLEFLEQQGAALPPESLDRFLLPMESALVGWRPVVVSAAEAEQLIHGQCVGAEEDSSPGQVCLYAPGNRFLGIGEIDLRGKLLPRRILVSPEPGARANVRVQYRASPKG